MRTVRKLKDGRELRYGGRHRYAAFRMTMHPYSVTGDSSAKNVVRWARDKHADNGFDYAVLDTTTGEVIATYPISLKERIDGEHADQS